MSESVVQSNLVSSLNELGWCVLRLNPTSLSFPDCERKYENGLPDLIAIKPKGLLCDVMMIEVKAKTGKTSPLQHLFHQACNKFGIKTIIFREGDNLNKYL